VPDLLTTAVERLLLAGARHRAAAASVAGLGGTDLLALEHLRAAGALSPSELADALLLSGSGTSALLRRLGDAGLVTRAPARGTGRRVLVTATAQAAAVSDDRTQGIVSGLGDLAEALAPPERAAVEAFLAALADVVERDTDRLVALVRSGGRDDVPVPPRWG
jgi:DNA-binding MarR family transcriptional regulator